MTLTVNEIADGASIATAVVAIWIWFKFVVFRFFRQRRLVKYLKEQRALDKRMAMGKTGKRSVHHLMANLSMTQDEVFDAAFRSKRVKPFPSESPSNGRADGVLFQFRERGEEQETWA